MGKDPALDCFDEESISYAESLGSPESLQDLERLTTELSELKDGMGETLSLVVQGADCAQYLTKFVLYWWTATSVRTQVGTRLREADGHAEQLTAGLLELLRESTDKKPDPVSVEFAWGLTRSLFDGVRAYRRHLQLLDDTAERLERDALYNIIGPAA